MSTNPYEGFQNLVATVPDLLQPLLVAAAGAIPYIEGEGSAALGVLAGLNPLLAALAGITGNILSVVLVVLLSSRVRAAAVARRPRVDPAGATTQVITQEPDEPIKPPSKGQQRIRRWLVRFGVPGASLIGPIALPTQLTAATFVATGVSKGWVILWQLIALVLWTSLVTAAATGILTVITD